MPGGVRAPTLYCPACGTNRGQRTLLLCSTCWQRLPNYWQRLAMKTAESDPKAVRCGEVAAKVISVAAKTRNAKP